MAGISGNGFEVLADLQAKLRALPQSLDEITERVAERLGAQLQQQIAAGLSPLGKPWKLNADGSIPALGSKATVEALKGQVIYKLSGKSYLHHTGIARGHVTRQVIPVASLHPSTVKLINDTIEEVLSEVFEQ
jgi:hypothetical protein